MNKENKNETLGSKLKQIRIKHGLSQIKMAKILGVEATYLSKLENNRLPHYLRVEKLMKIVKYFNLSLEEERELFIFANKIPPWMQKSIMDKKYYYKILRVLGFRRGYYA